MQKPRSHYLPIGLSTLLTKAIEEEANLRKQMSNYKPEDIQLEKTKENSIAPQWNTVPKIKDVPSVTPDSTPLADPTWGGVEDSGSSVVDQNKGGGVSFPNVRPNLFLCVGGTVLLVGMVGLLGAALAIDMKFNLTKWKRRK
jgi:hypothetical protein